MGRQHRTERHSRKAAKSVYSEKKSSGLWMPNGTILLKSSTRQRRCGCCWTDGESSAGFGSNGVRCSFFTTAKKYLNTLAQAQLTFQLQGYQYGPAKRHIKASKTYFADTGVIHGLGIPIKPGQLLECFVIAELEKRRMLGFINAEQFFYYKSVAGHEIDLVFEADEVLYAVEVKAVSRPDVRYV